MHSAVGRKLGLSGRELGHLANLPRSEFDDREWAALQFARAYALRGGRVPAGDYGNDFRQIYTEKEQRYVLRIIRQMDFANRVANTIFSERRNHACRIEIQE